MRVVLATRNEGKVRELRDLLGEAVELVSLGAYPDAPTVEEDGATFLANAEKKAHAVARHTGALALADDSGIEVDALGGAPGVHSARYAGDSATDEDNRRELLEALRGVPAGARGAQFRAVLVLARPLADGAETLHVAEGVARGRILEAPRGAAGFGYDPLVVIDGESRTYGEMSREEKARSSHRAQAARQMAAFLRALAG